LSRPKSGATVHNPEWAAEAETSTEFAERIGAKYSQHAPNLWITFSRAGFAVTVFLKLDGAEKLIADLQTKVAKAKAIAERMRQPCGACGRPWPAHQDLEEVRRCSDTLDARAKSDAAAQPSGGAS
jgi:hypothetical protein